MALLTPSLSRLYITQQEELSALTKKYEGVHSHNKFRVPSDFGIMNWMSNTDSDYPWKGIEGNIQTVDINNIRYINGVLRNTGMTHLHLLSDYYRSYESGFIDLLNAHNIYLHCPILAISMQPG